MINFIKVLPKFGLSLENSTWDIKDDSWQILFVLIPERLIPYDIIIGWVHLNTTQEIELG